MMRAYGSWAGRCAQAGSAADARITRTDRITIALVALADFQAPESATGLNRHGVPGNRWLIWSRVIVVVIFFRGRRHADLGDVEPVVEFLSKFPALHCFFQSRLVAAITRVSTWIIHETPDSRTLVSESVAVPQHVKELRLEREGRSAISSRKIVPLFAFSNCPGLR